MRISAGYSVYYSSPEQGAFYDPDRLYLFSAASAASAAEDVAQGVQAQIGRAHTHALIACGDRASVGLLPGGIPAAPGLELGEHIPVNLIIRLHVDCLLGVFESDGVVSDSAVGGCAVIVPLRAALLHGIEDIECLLEHAVIDVACGRTEMDGLLTAVLLVGALGAEPVGTEKLVPEIGEVLEITIVGIGGPVFILPGLAGTLLRRTVAACAAGASLGSSVARSAEAGSGIGVLALIHDLLVGLLDQLEHFLRLILVRIVDIGIGMVFAAELTVSFFDFVV